MPENGRHEVYCDRKCLFSPSVNNQCWFRWWNYGCESKGVEDWLDLNGQKLGPDLAVWCWLAGPAALLWSHYQRWWNRHILSCGAFYLAISPNIPGKTICMIVIHGKTTFLGTLMKISKCCSVYPAKFFSGTLVEYFWKL